jgi:hypothetical protein
MYIHGHGYSQGHEHVHGSGDGHRHGNGPGHCHRYGHGHWISQMYVLSQPCNYKLSRNYDLKFCTQISYLYSNSKNRISAF